MRRSSSFIVRIMAPRHAIEQIDELSEVWNARKLGTIPHFANNSKELTYSFTKQHNMEQFTKYVQLFGFGAVIIAA